MEIIERLKLAKEKFDLSLSQIAMVKSEESDTKPYSELDFISIINNINEELNLINIKVSYYTIDKDNVINIDFHIKNEGLVFKNDSNPNCIFRFDKNGVTFIKRIAVSCEFNSSRLSTNEVAMIDPKVLNKDDINEEYIKLLLLNYITETLTKLSVNP